MDIPPLFCAGIWVKRNLVPICIFDIYRIVACPENDVGELCVVPGPLEEELCLDFLPDIQDQFNSKKGCFLKPDNSYIVGDPSHATSQE